MKAYEFYLLDPVEGYELIGVLPERRRKTERITEASVIDWAKMIFGSHAKENNILLKRTILPSLFSDLRSEPEKPLLVKYPVFGNKI